MHGTDAIVMLNRCRIHSVAFCNVRYFAEDCTDIFICLIINHWLYTQQYTTKTWLKNSTHQCSVSKSNYNCAYTRLPCFFFCVQIMLKSLMTVRNNNNKFSDDFQNDLLDYSNWAWHSLMVSMRKTILSILLLLWLLFI